MPKPKKQMMEDLREKRAKEGLKRCEFWLTETEKKKLDEFLRSIRGKI